jgi:hypothetical protein
MNNLLNNLFKIKHESEIDDCVSKNKDKLIVIVFSIDNEKYFNRELHLTIKKFVKREMAPNNLNSIFLFVDLNNYIVTQNKYSCHVKPEKLCYTLYIYNTNQLTGIKNISPESLAMSHKELLEKIMTQQNSKPSEDEELMQENKKKKLEKIASLKTKFQLQELRKMKKMKQIDEEIDVNSNSTENKEEKNILSDTEQDVEEETEEQEADIDEEDNEDNEEDTNNSKDDNSKDDDSKDNITNSDSS